MLKSQAREMLVQLVVSRSAKQNQTLTRDESEWLVDSSLDGQLDDEALADCIGPAAVPVWNQLIAMLR